MTKIATDIRSTRQTGKPGEPDGGMLKRHGTGQVGSVRDTQRKCGQADYKDIGVIEKQ